MLLDLKSLNDLLTALILKQKFYVTWVLMICLIGMPSALGPAALGFGQINNLCGTSYLSVQSQELQTQRLRAYLSGKS